VAAGAGALGRRLTPPRDSPLNIRRLGASNPRVSTTGSGRVTRDADEEGLVAAAARGDAAALGALLDRHDRQARAMAADLLGPRTDLDDLLQEARLRAIRAIGSFEGRSAFGTWFSRIAMNLALSELRRRRLTAAAPIDDAADAAAPAMDPSRNVERRELRERLADAVERLPAGLRAVFDSVHRDGESPGAVAERLGLPAATVRTRLFHARRRLREALDDLVSE
jgi:RNA polymerase sigma-70 factor, ECF subfamily